MRRSRVHHEAALCAWLSRRNTSVGDCPDFRGGFAERKWDCPLHARQRDIAEMRVPTSSACPT